MVAIMRAIHIATLLLVAVVGANAVHPSLLLVDSIHGSYLKDAKDTLNAQASTLSGLMSALAGLMPPSPVDEEGLQTIEEALKSSPLKRPRAHMVFNIAGLQRDALVDVFSGRPMRDVQLEGAQEPAMLMADSLAKMAAANPGTPITLLDDKGLRGCVGNCIDEHMHMVAGHMNCRHSGASLTFESGAALDLSKLADKIFAAEAASLYGGLEAQVPEHEVEDVHILETTLVGIQALEATYGPNSEITVAARDFLKNFLRYSVAQLDAKYGGDITYQVTSLTADSSKSNVRDIMGRKQETRRWLAEATAVTQNSTQNSTFPGTPDDQVLTAKRFAEKACGYGVLILLAYFSLAAVWCMCFMPFKQDTMLFGAKKAE